jgi:hypothetical protein
MPRRVPSVMVLGHYVTAQKYVRVVMEKGTLLCLQGWIDMDKNEESRTTMTAEEAIRHIEQLGGVYDPTNTPFDVYDQLLVCESIVESHPVLELPVEQDGCVNGSNNGAYKRKDGFELTQSQLSAITLLHSYNYRTSPPLIAKQLEIIFADSNSEPNWWLFVAQHWNPRAICRTLEQIRKQQSQGWKTIKNPAAYFTFLLKYRAKRRSK